MYIVTVWMVLLTLTTSVCAFLTLLLLPSRTRRSVQLAILALRHQLTVGRRAGTRPRLKPADRILWPRLSRVCLGRYAQMHKARPRVRRRA